jgi:hypothetical protein
MATLANRTRSSKEASDGFLGVTEHVENRARHPHLTVLLIEAERLAYDD